jgi:hypothetical protein
MNARRLIPLSVFYGMREGEHQLNAWSGLRLASGSRSLAAGGRSFDGSGRVHRRGGEVGVVGANTFLRTDTSTVL